MSKEKDAWLPNGCKFSTKPHRHAMDWCPHDPENEEDEDDEE